MSDENVQYEDVAEAVVEVPCKVFTDSGVFIVSDVYSWSWIEQGIMCHGYWKDRDEIPGQDPMKRDVIFFLAQIKHLELDFDQLARFHAQQLADSMPTIEQGGGDIMDRADAAEQAELWNRDDDE